MCQALVFDFLPTAGDHPSLDDGGLASMKPPAVLTVTGEDLIAAGLCETSTLGLVAVGVLDGEGVGCFLHACIIPYLRGGVKR